ncbi:uncharacterized protein LOC131642224 [Vicia villosa]|uniref:uncharacterized protein LOC131642224 n=1 Tax=Vicia villosa TaxID=3911 RepID=UPI00273BC90E|nr:uncharacterized protein LOC131642224 [Vicia villosa]
MVTSLSPHFSLPLRSKATKPLSLSLPTFPPQPHFIFIKPQQPLSLNKLQITKNHINKKTNKPQNTILPDIYKKTQRPTIIHHPPPPHPITFTTVPLSQESMAEFKNNTNTSSSRFSIFNRSLTTLNLEEKQHPQKPQNLDRAASLRGRVVKKLCSFFEPTTPSSQEESPFSNKSKPLKSTESTSVKPLKSLEDYSPIIRLPGTEDRIVLYFTSLRGIRRTYEDCYAVRMILRGFRVWVDERDVSMDICYRKELMNVLGEKSMKNVTLPQVFIRGNLVGGAEVMKQLCEVGELGKILEGFPKTKAGFVCESCGDIRFMPCGNCSGSRKVFDEDEEVLKRCLECNENGLVRCPNCCSS